MFYFYNQGNEDLFLASADWMNRNLYRRIEVGFPMLDPGIKSELLKILKYQMADNTKAYQLNMLQQHRPNNRRKAKVRAQQDFYHWLKKKRRK
jgi:polyphosphate kinase